MEDNLSENKKLIINLLSSIIAFGINLIIGFYLSPYIVKNLGVEANGFISLANNFITKYHELIYQKFMNNELEKEEMQL